MQCNNNNNTCDEEQNKFIGNAQCYQTSRKIKKLTCRIFQVKQLQKSQRISIIRTFSAKCKPLEDEKRLNVTNKYVFALNTKIKQKNIKTKKCLVKSHEIELNRKLL